MQLTSRRPFTAYGTPQPIRPGTCGNNQQKISCATNSSKYGSSYIPLVPTVMLGGAPPEKKRYNDVRGKNKRERIQRVIPIQKEQEKDSIDVTPQYHSIVSLAKNILGETVSISMVETLIKEARSKYGS